MLLTAKLSVLHSLLEHSFCCIQEWLFWVIPVSLCAAVLFLLAMILCESPEDSDPLFEWTTQVCTFVAQDLMVVGLCMSLPMS